MPPSWIQYEKQPYDAKVLKTQAEITDKAAQEQYEDLAAYNTAYRKYQTDLLPMVITAAYDASSRKSSCWLKTKRELNKYDGNGCL